MHSDNNPSLQSAEAVKKQKETQLAWGQQQEITIIRPEGRMLMSSTWSLCKENKAEGTTARQ